MAPARGLSVLGRSVCAVALTSLLGSCGGTGETELATEGSAISAANALTANALTANALTANALTANALTANALTANALTANGLKDPLGRELLKYVVSCALPAGAAVAITVDGAKYQLPGSIGLAPQWGREHGSCDRECQHWVSACVLARVDAAGVQRMISIRGDDCALRPGPRELQEYPHREATYYGNIFVENQPRYLCLSPGATSDARVCGPSLSDCPMTVTGSCDDVCGDRGAFGTFSDCRTPRRGDRGRGEVFAETVTVFLP